MKMQTGYILVVDDNEDNRDILSRRLKREGHRVALAENGQQALDIVAKEHFDLVLLDIMMPGMSGLEVLKRLRETYSPTQLPIIMATAKDQSKDIVEALKLGANDYVTKPLDFPVVLARVQTHLTLYRLEEALKSEKEFKESLIESAYEMIISVDLERRISQFNKASEEKFGYGRNEVLGKHVDMLYADPEEYVRIHDQSVRKNGFVGEVRNKTKNGEIFCSSLSASVLRDKLNQPIGVMTISLDITEKKKIEVERERLQKLKDEFLSIASHDIKHPLSTIMGYASLVQKMFPVGTTVTEEGHEFLAKIYTHSRAMQRIVEDFLDFQALEDGHVKLTLAALNLNETVGKAIEAQAHYAKAKEISLRFEPEADLPVIRADGSRIEQVIINLVNNAIKFSPKGSAVTVRTQSDQKSITSEVIDSGPGIAKEDMPKLFIKYARLSNVPTAGEKSSGVGLAICKNLIDLHGGQIGVRNNKDRGATFWFRLPIR
jgi:PAS domain S-box-containing protein